jgi:type 1 fimbria pilin
MLGRSTEALRRFKDELEVTAGQNLNINELSRLRLGEKIPGAGPENEIYMICDSRKISLFRINSVNFETMYAGGNSASSQIISGLINMKLTDSSGIAFMNFLKYMSDEVLGCSLVNCFFLLKVFFVGHTHDQTTEVFNASSIPMMLQTMSFEFETASSIGAAQYDIKFMPTFAGGQSTNQLVPSDRISSIAARGAQTTLGAAIDSLQNALNKISKDHFNTTVYESLNEKTQKTEPSLPDNKRGRIVLYKISLPGDIKDIESSTKWRDLPYTLGVSEKIEEISHKKDAAENEKNKQADTRKDADKKDKSVKDDAVYKAVPRNLSITEILTTILTSCVDVNRKASFKSIEDGKIVSFKILTNITSSDDTVVIHFDIVEHIFVNTTPDEKPKAKAVGLNDRYFIENEKGEKVPKNSLEFDYVFSGRNSDILDFSVKIDASAALFAVMNKTKSTPDQIRKNDLGQSETGPGAKSTDNSKNVSIREMKSYDMILPPPKTANEKTGYSNLAEGSQEKSGISATELAKSKQEYLKVLADIHGQSSLSTKMKIRGNPDLFVKSLGNKILPHISISPGSLSSNREVTFLDNSVKEYNDALAQRLNTVSPKSNNPLMAGYDFSLSPLYVKVNIYGPKIDPVFGNQLMPGVEKFAQQYFYDGWYFVFKIAHFLEGNTFTQEIDMGAVEVFKSALIKSEKTK